MTLVNDIRKSVTDTTPVLALVGATDLVFEKVREAREQAGHRVAQVRADLDVETLRGRAQQVPTVAVSTSIELAARAEEAYGDLAARGEELVARIKRQKATQELIAQGKVTVSRGRAAVTTVRNAATDTRTAAKATSTTARREGGEVLADTRRSAAKRTATKASAKRTATIARKRTTTARSTTKSAATSARKTGKAATKATGAAAAKVGS